MRVWTASGKFVCARGRAGEGRKRGEKWVGGERLVRYSGYVFFFLLFFFFHPLVVVQKCGTAKIANGSWSNVLIIYESVLGGKCFEKDFFFLATPRFLCVSSFSGM